MLTLKKLVTKSFKCQFELFKGLIRCYKRREKVAANPTAATAASVLLVKLELDWTARARSSSAVGKQCKQET